MAALSAQTAAPAAAEPDLLLICIFAFVAVFLLLSTLAALMRGLTLLFPGASADADTAVLAAIAAAAGAAYPGMRLTRVEEIR